MNKLTPQQTQKLKAQANAIVLEFKEKLEVLQKEALAIVKADEEEKIISVRQKIQRIKK